jgi:acetyl/propionyl-CoA carboxylase alpha subunit
MLPLPMQGTIVEVAVESGATAEEGQLVCVIVAMRMGNEITVHEAGTIADLAIACGRLSRPAGALVVIKPASE